MKETKESLRERLLEEGLEKIGQEGWEQLSLRKLSRACQVSHVASYRHFKNKDDFIWALIPLVSHHFVLFLQEGEEEANSPRQRICHLAQRFILYSQEHAHYFDFLFLSKYALATQTDENGQLGLEREMDCFEHSRKRIQEFIDSLAGSYDFNQTFMHLWGFIFGLSLLVRQKLYPAPDQVLAQLIEEILDFYQ
ncbi:hypothetical protein C4K46_02090 [Streptococcus oricebi]|uniref:HTH tetR-type domain-containing protein n=2 Tax=Streptococcus oricebi TaxID=1547447 RepID=A0ABS5B1M1_9STRE|nr:hypothetical protein [Streptococcus oricebi]